MKVYFLSQRVDVVENYAERRDSLDQRWVDLLCRNDSLVLPVPNNRNNLVNLLRCIKPDFIVLTGGDTPEAYGGATKERDYTDYTLINFALTEKIPLLGVCRGMQSIALSFGATLEKVEKHVNVEHYIENIKGEKIGLVNSFHNYSIGDIGDELEVVARSCDGKIEAIKHKKADIYGVMWHPERSKTREKDIINQLFNVNL